MTAAMQRLLSRPGDGLSFAERHPWVVYDAEGQYAARFTTEEQARKHAQEINGGPVDFDAAAHWAVRE